MVAVVDGRKGIGDMLRRMVRWRAGINAISIAVPAKEEAPFVLDMATTVVAMGKVEIALRTGMIMPGGWAVSKRGEPITDPKQFYEEAGALLPLGGTPQLGSHKGVGLSVAVDIMSSILSGSMAISEVLSEPNNVGRSNHFFGALRIDGFMPVDEFRRAMDRMLKVYRALPKAAGVDRIYLAGEIERETENRRRSSGIPPHPTTVVSFQELAEELGIEYDL